VSVNEILRRFPEHYQLRPLPPEMREGWLDWSLDFFTDGNVLQVPYVDMVVQPDVSEAFAEYSRVAGAQDDHPGSFFAFMVWHIVQAMKAHPSFLLRQIDGEWFEVHNAPVVVPVAVGGAPRFREIAIDDVALMSYEDFAACYRETLERARQGDRHQAMAPELFYIGHVFGNLPSLQFSSLTLHYRREAIAGQTLFYFGKRYFQGERLHIPFAAKLHHATTDPFVFGALLEGVLGRFPGSRGTPDP